MYDAIIISDLHLGSEICQAEHISDFLHKVKDGELPAKQLILNGDVFDSWDFRRLRKRHWKVLSTIRALADEVEVIWINGNHDGPAEIVSHLIGATVEEEIILESGERRILILHGHRFDKFISDHPVVVWFADLFYWLLQKIDKSFYWARLAKKSAKQFLRNCELIRDRAVEYCKKKKCDVVCCGHTHMEESCPGEISYYNSGCWTEKPSSYLIVKNGRVEQRYFG